MKPPPFPAAAIAAAQAAVKAQLRIVGDGEDALIARLAASALALAEAFTGRSLIARDHHETLTTGFGWQPVTAVPVTAITQVTGVPAEGAGFALPPGGHAVDIDPMGHGWVRVSAPGIAGRIAVTYRAGIAEDWAGLPDPLVHGVTVLAAHLFETREQGGAVPAAVAALWRPWRRIGLSGRERRA